MSRTIRDTALFRFSTDALPAAARDRAVRALYEHTLLSGKLEPLEPLPDCPVRVEISKLLLPGLGVLSGSLSGVRQRARPEHETESDDIFLGVNVAGTSVACQGEREIRINNGDALLARPGRNGFVVNRPTSTRFIGLRIPRRALAARAAGPIEIGRAHV